MDLDPFEEAEGIEKLIQEWHITQEEAAKRLGKKQSTIANKLRLLRLAPEEREAIQRAGLTERHAQGCFEAEGRRTPVYRSAAYDRAGVKC